MKRQLTQRAAHNELSFASEDQCPFKRKKQFPALHENKPALEYYLFMLSFLNDFDKLRLFFVMPLFPLFPARPYLKHGLVSYPVSGVDVPGHLSQFIGPGRGLPLGAAPL